MNPQLHDLAGGYALGLLDGDEWAEANRRFVSDAEFWAAVTTWRSRLAPLLDEVEPTVPPPPVWLRIEREIGAANDNRQGSRGDAAWWRGATAAASLLAAALAMVLLVQPSLLHQPPIAPPVGAPIAPSVNQPSAAAPAMVAMIGDSKATKVVANWDPAMRRLVLAVAGTMPADNGKAHELWVIPKDGVPSSLGTMPDRKTVAMDLAKTLAKLIDQGATIAISVEPMGGSKTGKPTGPVIASGTLETI